VLTPLLVIQILVFGFAIWFGFFLLARDFYKAGLRFAGLGLAAYALGLGLDVLTPYAAQPEIWLRWRWPLLFVPALCWFGATLYLLPETNPQLELFANLGLIPAILFLYGVAFITDLPINVNQPGYWVFAFCVALLLIWAIYIGWQTSRSGIPRKPFAWFIVGTLFFGLGMGLLLLPIGLFPAEIMLLAIGGDLVVLGLVIVALDAFDEGEALLPDFIRSFGFSFFAALLFGGQVALAMILGEGITFPLLTLLLIIITSAVATQTFSDPIQTLLDHVIFARFARLRQARAELRAASSALPRVNESLDLDILDEAEFARLTRRALSHFGDLQRLASSPLTRLAIIEARLTERGDDGNTLERAAELKALLTEGIARLKPRDKGNFGTSDEWRYYNALYFPYVVGLKPYSLNSDHDNIDAASQAALEWFRAYVPERTLHNWQNAGAKLIAKDLREHIWQ
jgi:hypothetical protein